MSRAEAETIFNGTIKDTLAKSEALEKHVNTLNKRAESLATTEADFFKTLLDRQEEAQKHLYELAAQLSQQNTATPFHAMKTAQRRKKKQAHEWSTKFVLFSYIVSESEEVWFDVRPKAVGKKRP